MKKGWYCYVCGKKLQKSYYLYSLMYKTDRVFLVCKKCIEQVDEQDTTIIKVIEAG